jgi:hypothetical protein
MLKNGNQSALEQFEDINSKVFTENLSIGDCTPKRAWTPTWRRRTTSNITA